MGFATNAIHVGQEPDPSTGAIVAPIYQTSTYVQTELGKDKGYDYARTNHPNRKALERTVAKLEGGQSAYVFSSGMAAIDAVFRLLRPGDHVIVSEAVYGGVYRLSTQLLVHFGLEFTFVDTSSIEAVTAALRPNTKMLYVETPTNPTLRVADIAAMSKIASERGVTLVVDNTFLSPYLQRPIEFGAHIVVHSMTKYLNGHSDSTGGAVILRRPKTLKKSTSFSGPRVPAWHRWIASSSHAESRPWRCACSSTTPTASPWRATWTPTPRSERFITRACLLTRNMKLPANSSGVPERCSPSTSKISMPLAASSIRSNSARWPRASAASKR